MTKDEVIRKLEYCKKAYQMLIDEKVDSGKLVGDGVRGEWKADTPLSAVYESMIEAFDFAIKALKQQPCEDCIRREEVLKLLEKEDWADTVYGIMALPSVIPQQEVEDERQTEN